MAALASLLLFGAAAPGVIAVQLPDDSTCQPEQVLGGLRTRLRHAAVQAGEGTGAHQVQLVLRLSREGWVVELKAPGQLPLARRLAVELRDCVGLAEAAALITERYLDSIDWATAAGEVRPLPPAPHWQASLALGGGGALGLTGPAPMAQLDVGAGYARWLIELSLAYLGWGAWDLQSPTLPVSAFHHTGAVAFGVSRLVDLPTGALRFGLAPGLDLYWVGNTVAPGADPNPLPHRQLVFAPLSFLGAHAGYELPLGEAVSLGIRLQVRAHLGSVTFFAEGLSPSLTTHPLEGDLTVVVRSHFF